MASGDGGASWSALAHQPDFGKFGTGNAPPADIELLRPSARVGYVLIPGADLPPTGTRQPGVLALTTDGGTSWVTGQPPCADRQEVLAADSPADLWLFCSGEPATDMVPKSVYRSGDFGRHWSVAAAVDADQGLPTTGSVPLLGVIDFAMATGPSTAWLGLDRSGLWATYDGGQHWSQPFAFGFDCFFSAGTHLGSDLAWVVAARTIWHTSDGRSWHTVGPAASC